LFERNNVTTQPFEESYRNIDVYGCEALVNINISGLFHIGLNSYETTTLSIGHYRHPAEGCGRINPRE